LSTVAGFQVPWIPFFEVVGNIGAVVPAQNGGMGSNVGTYIGSDKMIPGKKISGATIDLQRKVGIETFIQSCYNNLA
jgi:hypothetical protein